MCACCSRKAFGIWEPGPAETLLSILLMWLCLLLPTASSESSFGPSVAFLEVKKLSGDSVTPLLLPHRMVMSLACILSGSGNGVFFGPYSREVLPHSFALTQLKVVATMFLENAVPLGSSRGMVAPSFTVQAALRYGCSLQVSHVPELTQSLKELCTTWGDCLQWLPAPLYGD